MPLRLRRGAASRKRLAPPTAEPEGRDHPPPDVVEGNGPPDSQERGDLVGGEQVLASKAMSSVWWSGAIGFMLVRGGQGPFRSITPELRFGARHTAVAPPRRSRTEAGMVLGEIAVPLPGKVHPPRGCVEPGDELRILPVSALCRSTDTNLGSLGPAASAEQDLLAAVAEAPPNLDISAADHQIEMVIARIGNLATRGRQQRGETVAEGDVGARVLIEQDLAKRLPQLRHPALGIDEGNLTETGGALIAAKELSKGISLRRPRDLDNTARLEAQLDPVDFAPSQNDGTPQAYPSLDPVGVGRGIDLLGRQVGDEIKPGGRSHLGTLPPGVSDETNDQVGAGAAEPKLF